MRLDISREWFESRARLEEGHEIGAGLADPQCLPASRGMAVHLVSFRTREAMDQAVGKASDLGIKVLSTHGESMRVLFLSFPAMQEIQRSPYVRSVTEDGRITRDRRGIVNEGD